MGIYVSNNVIFGFGQTGMDYNFKRLVWCYHLQTSQARAGFFLGDLWGTKGLPWIPNGPTKVHCFPSAFAALSFRSVRGFAERLAMSQPCSLLFWGQRIVYTSFGGVLKWGYPKSSKSLEHFSIETHGFGDYPFWGTRIKVSLGEMIERGYHCCGGTSLWRQRTSPRQGPFWVLPKKAKHKGLPRGSVIISRSFPVQKWKFLSNLWVET